MEDHPEFEGRLTRRLARKLVADAKVMTISAAARPPGLGWHLVMAVVRGWSELVAEHRTSRKSRVVLVDETFMRRRHRYVTVIVNGDTGRTPGDSAASQRGRAQRVLHLTGPALVPRRASRR